MPTGMSLLFSRSAGSKQVREKMLGELARRTDEWLDDCTSFGSGQRVNNHFKWFHVFGHELNHRGQIRWLRTRAATRPE